MKLESRVQQLKDKLLKDNNLKISNIDTLKKT